MSVARTLSWLALLLLVSPALAPGRLSEPPDSGDRAGRAGCRHRHRSPHHRNRGEAILGGIVIENKPGAGMRIGASLAARSAPDGYTLLFTAPAPIVASQIIPPKLDFDPVHDFRPLVIGVFQPVLLIVRPSLGVKIRRGIRRLCEEESRQDLLRQCRASAVRCI